MHLVLLRLILFESDLFAATKNRIRIRGRRCGLVTPFPLQYRRRRSNQTRADPQEIPPRNRISGCAFRRQTALRLQNGVSCGHTPKNTGGERRTPDMPCPLARQPNWLEATAAILTAVAFDSGDPVNLMIRLGDSSFTGIAILLEFPRMFTKQLPFDGGRISASLC